MTLASQNYAILKQLESLGRITAFLAIQQAINREVMLYQVALFHSDSPQMLGICERELKRWARLEHPNLSVVFDGWLEDRKVCFVARKLGGSSLSEILGRGVAPEMQQALEIAGVAARVFHYLHECAVYLGATDLSSYFVLEEDRWVRMTERGLVSQLDAKLEKAQFQTLESEDESHEAMLRDISAWGALCGALVSGNKEFGHKHVVGKKEPEFTLEDVNLRQKHPDLPDTLERIILKALATSLAPPQGYSGFAEILSDILKISSAKT
jgi:hypothetical protein